VKIWENFKRKFEKISNFSENKRKPRKSNQVAELSELQKVNYFGTRVPKLPYTYGMQVLIWSYLWSLFIKELHYNNCKVDCIMNLIAFHVKLSFLKVYFSVLALFVIVHVTSNPKKLLYAKIWKHCGEGQHIKYKKHAFLLL